MGRLRKFLKGIVAGGAASVAAMAAVNAAVAREVPEPETGALGGEAGTYDWKHGHVFYRHAGHEDAPAALFIHGLGAGTRSFMWRRNFEPLARDFRVYAIDLLGFGYSDKPASAPYSSDLYAELIADFLRDVVARPASVVAHTLSAAFAVRVADEQPELINSLVLISPTGADNLSARPGMTGAAFYGLLHSPVLGTSFYNAVTSERGIRDYAREQLFHEKRFATPRLVAHYYAVSHSRTTTPSVTCPAPNTPPRRFCPATSTRTYASHSRACASPRRSRGDGKTPPTPSSTPECSCV
jgi:pimeloyl-ACP methyl ester carboxylesterase